MTEREYYQVNSMRRKVARESPEALLFYLCYGVVVLATLYFLASYLRDGSMGWELVLFVIFSVYALLDLLAGFTPFWAWLWISFFRKAHYYRKEMNYTVSQDGLLHELPSIKSETKWDVLILAKETDEGFAIFPRSVSRYKFHWLPKHGFSAPQGIAVCRELLREHIKDFKVID